jgi:predicted metalloprotease with PDZ domain
MIGIINRLTKKDYHDFYQRYVFGTEIPNYDQIFGYAGYKLERKDQQVPDLGFFGRFRSGGFAINGIEPNSAASAAGLKQGDVIVKIDGRSVVGFPIGSLAGKAVKFTVLRAGSETEIPMRVASRTVKSFDLVSVPGLSPQQTLIRERWLKR